MSLVHNGVIGNHLEIADKFGLKLTGECDSEVLLRLIERAEHPLYGLKDCLREVEGSMAVAVLDRQEGVLYLARNRYRPLWLARLKNDRRWWVASTPSILLTAFEAVLEDGAVKDFDYLAPVPPDCPIMLGVDGYLLAPMGGGD